VTSVISVANAIVVTSVISVADAIVVTSVAISPRSPGYAVFVAFRSRATLTSVTRAFSRSWNRR
jgi:hypothetical protein